jgi:predicted permease
MLIAWGVGLWRGVGYRFSETGSTWKDRWETANKIYFTITMPLLFIAAIIEGRYHIFKEVSGILPNF